MKLGYSKGILTTTEPFSFEYITAISSHITKSSKLITAILQGRLQIHIAEYILVLLLLNHLISLNIKAHRCYNLHSQENYKFILLYTYL